MVKEKNSTTNNRQTCAFGVRHVLCAPATSSPVEWVISHGTILCQTSPRTFECHSWSSSCLLRDVAVADHDFTPGHSLVVSWGLWWCLVSCNGLCQVSHRANLLGLCSQRRVSGTVLMDIMLSPCNVHLVSGWMYVVGLPLKCFNGPTYIQYFQ